MVNQAMMASIGLDPARFGAHSINSRVAPLPLAAGLSPTQRQGVSADVVWMV